MKAVILLFISIISPFLFSSCKKDVDLNITGKWIIQETFNGFGDGGDFKWHTIPDQYKRVLEFTSDGYYNEGIGSGCNGIYKVVNNEIYITSPCGPYSFTFNYGLMPNTVIFTHMVIEGVIKEKYTRIN